MAPKKTIHVGGVLGDRLGATHHLHELLENLTLPLSELSGCSLVAIETPPVAIMKWEEKLLSLIQKIQGEGSHPLCIVQPSLRKRTQRSTWVYR